jgi:hypothetical protein
VGRIVGHWRKDQSQQYHPKRFDALSLVRLVHDFQEVKSAIRAECGEDPEVVMPDARPLANPVSYAQLRAELEDPKRTRPLVIVFGTGWGIAEPFYPEVHRILAPIHGPKQESTESSEMSAELNENSEPKRYNHLSVRAAAAIVLDRLFGT